MSYCRKEGKDVVMFVTEEDHKIPSKVVLSEPEPEPGLILPNGEINWNCPCLGGIATGPCAVEFRTAFSCFHYSEADPKGSDCYDQFQEMQGCMSKYPSLYSREMDDHSIDDHSVDDHSVADQRKNISLDYSAEKQADPKDEVIESKKDPSETGEK